MPVEGRPQVSGGPGSSDTLARRRVVMSRDESDTDGGPVSGQLLLEVEGCRSPQIPSACVSIPRSWSALRDPNYSESFSEETLSALSVSTEAFAFV
jgi:hypothetical protein